MPKLSDIYEEAKEKTEQSQKLGKQKSKVQPMSSEAAGRLGQSLEEQMIATLLEAIKTAEEQQVSPFESVAEGVHPLSGVLPQVKPKDRFKFQGKIYNSVGLAKATTRASKRWDSSKINELQRRLGISGLPGVTPGKYDPITHSYHIAYVMQRESIGEKSVDSIINEYRKQRKESYEAKIEQEIEQEKEKFMKYKQTKQNANDLWRTLMGYVPEEATSEYLTKKFEGGWNSYDFYTFLRQTPGFKKRFPGIPEDMLPSEYLTEKKRLNEHWIQTRGHPVSPEEFVRIVFGGEIIK